MPLYFVENQGQMDERVSYYIQGSDKNIYFSPEGVTFALTVRRAIDRDPAPTLGCYPCAALAQDAGRRPV